MLSENIRAMRMRKGLSQEELAGRVHVVRQTVSKWEKNLSVPDAAALIGLAEALDTTVSALLGEEAAPPEAREDAAEGPSVQELATRLEALNARLARQSERRRRGWRIAFLVLLALAVLALALEGAMYFAAWRFAGELDSTVGIIGGADGPTSIFVSSVPADAWPMIGKGLLLVAAVAGLWRTRRR